MGLRKKKTLIDQAGEYVESVRPHLEAAYETTKDAVEDFVESTAKPLLADAREKAGPALAEARDQAVSYAHDARDKAAPFVADAREHAVAYAHDAKEKAAPYVASGTALVAEKAGEAKELADAQVARIKGEPEPKKGSKAKKLLLFAVVAGVVGFVATKLRSKQAADNWQSSYVPTPPPAAPKVEDDAAGASPDEAKADEAESPKAPTTPDAPAEVTVVDPEAEKK